MNKEERRKLELLGELNTNFIKSLENVIVPFFHNLHTIHLNNVELNDAEKKRITESIEITRYFSQKEAEIENSLYAYIKNGAEKAIIEGINREIAKVQKIANDAERGRYEALYSECEQLLNDLIKIEGNVENILRSAA